VLLNRTHELWRLIPVWREIHRLGPDVVYTMFPFPYRAHMRIAGLAARAPVVTQVWSELHWNSRPAVAATQRMIDRTTASLPGAVVAPSTALFRQLLEIGIPRKRVRLIPYGVRPDVIASAAAPMPSDVDAMLNRFPLRVAYVARLDANKNQLGALTVFAKAGVNDACLLLLGAEDQPGYEDRLRAHAAALGVSERVLFAGDTDRAAVWSLLRSTSVLLQTSRHEGFPQAPLEAQAVGVPVVAYRAGGMTDVVDDEVTGFLVGVDEEDAAATRLRQLLLDGDLRRDMGSAGIHWVRTRFDLNGRLPELFDLFEQLAEGRALRENAPTFR
jgi:glycosyltransferase involved in cell wall biosynthesis